MGNNNGDGPPRRTRKRIRQHDDDEEDHEEMLEILQFAERFLEEQIERLDRLRQMGYESTDDEADETDESEEPDEIIEFVKVLDDGSLFAVPVRENLKKPKKDDDGAQIVPSVDNPTPITAPLPQYDANLSHALLAGAPTLWRLDPTGGLFIERIMNIVSNPNNGLFDGVNLSSGGAVQASGASLNEGDLFQGGYPYHDDINYEEPTSQQPTGVLDDNNNVAEDSNENEPDEKK